MQTKPCSSQTMKRDRALECCSTACPDMSFKATRCTPTNQHWQSNYNRCASLSDDMRLRQIAPATNDRYMAREESGHVAKADGILPENDGVWANFRPTHDGVQNGGTVQN